MFSELCVANYDYLLFPFIIVHCLLFALSSKTNTSNKITVSFFKYTHTQKKKPSHHNHSDCYERL